MYEDRININIIISEYREDELIKPISTLECDGKGRASFSIRTMYNFINYRISNDLLFGYYIRSLDTVNGHWIMLANAAVESPGKGRLNESIIGCLDAPDFVFMEPGDHVLELYMCERLDIGDINEADVDYKRIGKLVSTYFFAVH